ncbi:flagellar brake protein [Zooshikella sp. RANM57]|uniref:flagellar brake protein n=1 Tax=Zooshikella sp. RANM57 TaxID=3425863 RepID=UPI003D6DBA47
MFSMLRWFKQSVEKEKDLVSFHVLSRLCRDHSFINVKINDDEHIFRSMILMVDPQEEFVLIDDLYPPAPEGFINDGCKVKVDCSERGHKTHFVTTLMSIESFEDMPALKLELPETLQHSQRRSDYRVSISQTEYLKVVLSGFGTKVVNGRILDLSTKGIQIKFAGPIPDGIRQDVIVNNCMFTLPDGTSIKCRILVSHARCYRKPITYTLVGGRLIDLPSKIQKKLDQFIFKIQREQRRRELDNT